MDLQSDLESQPDISDAEFYKKDIRFHMYFIAVSYTHLGHRPGLRGRKQSDAHTADNDDRQAQRQDRRLRGLYKFLRA